MAHISHEYVQEYTVREEIVNAISHGIGMLLSIAGFAILLFCAIKDGNGWRVAGFSVFGTTLILLYLASTLYHSFSLPKVKSLFQIIDHAAIFLLIAGTYTPFMMVNLRGPWGWSFLGVVWGLAVLGVLLKVFYMSRFQKTSMALYIVMGWLCLIPMKQLILHVPHLSLTLLIFGGVSYMIGLIFYAWQRLPYHHAVWHIFVLSGSILHYFSVLYTL